MVVPFALGGDGDVALVVSALFFRKGSMTVKSFRDSQAWTFQRMMLPAGGSSSTLLYDSAAQGVKGINVLLSEEIFEETGERMRNAVSISVSKLDLPVVHLGKDTFKIEGVRPNEVRVFTVKTKTSDDDGHWTLIGTQ